MAEKYIVIIPLQFGWKWTADYQKQTALRLAKKGLVVLYCEYQTQSFSKLITFKAKRMFVLKDNLLFFNPIDFIPFSRIKCLRTVNRFINQFILVAYLSSKKARDIVLWLFSPSDIHLQFLFKKALLTLYDCVDYFSSSDRDADKKIQKLQRKLIEQVDIMVVNSKTLLKIHKKLRADIRLVPQGFDAVVFSGKSNNSNKILKKKSKKPMIGFVGAINYRLDYRLLYKLIKNNPHLEFVFWGPIKKNEQDKIFNTHNQISKLKTLANTVWGESSDRNKVYSLVNEFDIGIIPYDVGQKFNKYCYPMKVFEYFYMGKPVISTSIEELKNFPEFVRIGNTSREWSQHIQNLLKKPWPDVYKQQQYQLAIDNSWENKIKSISKIISNQKQL